MKTLLARFAVLAGCSLSIIATSELPSPLLHMEIYKGPGLPCPCFERYPETRQYWIVNTAKMSSIRFRIDRTIQLETGDEESELLTKTIASGGRLALECSMLQRPNGTCVEVQYAPAASYNSSQWHSHADLDKPETDAPIIASPRPQSFKVAP